MKHLKRFNEEFGPLRGMGINKIFDDIKKLVQSSNSDVVRDEDSDSISYSTKLENGDVVASSVYHLTGEYSTLINGKSPFRDNLDVIPKRHKEIFDILDTKFNNQN